MFISLMPRAMVALLGIACAWAADPQSDALLARIAAAHQAVATVQGRALWRTRLPDDPAGPPRLQDVHFYLQAPDRYCVVFTKPGDEEWKHSFLSDGVRRWEVERQFAGDPPDVKVAPAGRDDADFRRLIACFRMDLPALQRDFTVSAAPAADGKGATVTLLPARPEIAEQLTRLVMDLDAQLHVARLGWDDPQGNHYDVGIEEATYDQPIPPTVFTWGKPGD